MSKEKPIIFSTEMVKAILAGRKTMTRRVVKHQPPEDYEILGRITSSTDWEVEGCACWISNEGCISHYCRIPYEAGDILWVRETWERLDCSCCEGDFTGRCFNDRDDDDNGCYVYRATHKITGDARWRPSIHMPRTAARLFLKVNNIRVERLWDITNFEAASEGINYKFENVGDSITTPRLGFAELWDGLNAKRGYRWDLNSWVWVIEFEQTTEEKSK